MKLILSVLFKDFFIVLAGFLSFPCFQFFNVKIKEINS